MEDKIIEKKESLELIEKMIITSQNKKNPYMGWYFLVWGYIVFFSAMLVAIFFDHWPNRMANLFWMLIPLMGLPVTFFLNKIEAKNYIPKGYIDKMVNSVSIVINIAIFTVMVGSSFVRLPILPIILLLSSVHCATIGLVTHFRLLTVVGIVGIFFSMIFYMLPFTVLQVYLFGFSYLFLLCIPGHYLIYLNKKNRA